MLFPLVSSHAGYERPACPDGSPFNPSRWSTRTWGMLVLLISLAVFFAPLLFLYVLMRVQHRADGVQPALTGGFLLATGSLIALSVVMHAAVRAVQADQRAALRGWLGLALALAVGFVVCQSYNWSVYLQRDVTAGTWRVVGFFYFFTAIHALHVIGGMAPLVITTANAWRGRYTRQRYAGVQHCAAYWHFLDCVWLVMFAAFFVLPF